MSETENPGLELADTDAASRQLAMAATIVASYVVKNAVPAAELPALIASIHTSLGKVGAPAEAVEADEPLVPAVPIKKSVTPDYIICLEDGKKFKSLKRHLQAAFGMTPDDYRAKWGLPRDYPMVAANYASMRSQLAKKTGLGARPVKAKRPRKNAA